MTNPSDFLEYDGNQYEVQTKYWKLRGNAQRIFLGRVPTMVSMAEVYASHGTYPYVVAKVVDWSRVDINKTIYYRYFVVRTPAMPLLFMHEEYEYQEHTYKRIHCPERIVLHHEITLAVERRVKLTLLLD